MRIHDTRLAGIRHSLAHEGLKSGDFSYDASIRVAECARFGVALPAAG